MVSSSRKQNVYLRLGEIPIDIALERSKKNILRHPGIFKKIASPFSFEKPNQVKKVIVRNLDDCITTRYCEDICYVPKVIIADLRKKIYN